MVQGDEVKIEPLGPNHSVFVEEKRAAFHEKNSWPSSVCGNVWMHEWLPHNIIKPCVHVPQSRSRNWRNRNHCEEHGINARWSFWNAMKSNSTQCVRGDLWFPGGSWTDNIWTWANKAFHFFLHVCCVELDLSSHTQLAKKADLSPAR